MVEGDHDEEAQGRQGGRVDDDDVGEGEERGEPGHKLGPDGGFVFRELELGIEHRVVSLDQGMDQLATDFTDFLAGC